MCRFTRSDRRACRNVVKPDRAESTLARSCSTLSVSAFPASASTVRSRSASSLSFNAPASSSSRRASVASLSSAFSTSTNARSAAWPYAASAPSCSAVAIFTSASRAPPSKMGAKKFAPILKNPPPRPVIPDRSLLAPTPPVSAIDGSLASFLALTFLNAPKTLRSAAATSGRRSSTSEGTPAGTGPGIAGSSAAVSSSALG